MIGFHPDCPPSMALLADHLDSALAAGEDLMAAMLPARADLDETDAEAAPDAVDAFVRRLQQLESSLLLRVLQARRLAVEIGRADTTLKAAGSLFRAQTEALHELILRAGRNGDGGLTRFGDNYAYLRSRGLIAPEAAAPSPYESLTVGEGFRVGGVAGLSQILDMVSAVLDLLDARFGLYVPELVEGGVPEVATDDEPTMEIGQAGSPQCEPAGAALGGDPSQSALVAAVAEATSGSTGRSEQSASAVRPPAAGPSDGGTALAGLAKSDEALRERPAGTGSEEAVDASEPQPSSGPRSLPSMVADIGTVP